MIKKHNYWQRFRHHRLVVQFIEYCIGGGVFFWTGYGTFALCYSGIGLNWLVSKIIGDALGFSVNYLMQRYWAFSDPRLAAADSKVKTRYIILTIVDFAIDYALVGSLKHYGVTPYIGFWVSAAFFVGWNYFFYRFWVFRTD